MADFQGRTGGPFLDQIEMEQRELKSAQIEKRDPDFSRDNLAPLVVQDEEVKRRNEERVNATQPTEIKTFEVDFNSAESVENAIKLLTSYKDNLEKDGDTTPSSLLPGVPDPTKDGSVTPENVNTPVPTVPTGDTVASGEVPESNNEESEDNKVTTVDMVGAKIPVPDAALENQAVSDPSESVHGVFSNLDGKSTEEIQKDVESGEVSASDPNLPQTVDPSEAESTDQADLVEESTTPIARDERGIVDPPVATRVDPDEKQDFDFVDNDESDEYKFDN